MARRTFSQEFKIEALKLVTERGVSVPQANRDLDLAESVLRRWMREAAAVPTSAFPGHGQPRAEPAEIAALKKEVAKLKAERDILKKGRHSGRRGGSGADLARRDMCIGRRHDHRRNSRGRSPPNGTARPSNWASLTSTCFIKRSSLAVGGSCRPPKG